MSRLATGCYDSVDLKVASICSFASYIIVVIYEIVERLPSYSGVNVDRTIDSIVLFHHICQLFFVWLLVSQSMNTCAGKQCSYSTTILFSFLKHIDR